MKKSILTVSILASVLLLSGCQLTKDSHLNAKMLITNNADLCHDGLKSMTLSQSDNKDVTSFICK